MHDVGSGASPIETRILEVGASLSTAINDVLIHLPGGEPATGELARMLGVDKVLASRLLKAARQKDPIAVIQLMPGPEPLRRVIRAASRRGVPASVVDPMQTAVDQFEHLIRQEAGDRSALEAMLSAWLPETRREFELRRKQAAFRAMSQLKGASARVNLATVLLHPAADGRTLDVVWVFGLLGLQRLRPGVSVKFASRRLSKEPAPRRPRTLDGDSVDGLDGLRLDAYCSQPPVDIAVHRVNDVVHYSLAGEGFGPRSASDLVFAEVNVAEMARTVPAGSQRKRYVFAEVSTPVERLIFDALVFDGSFPTPDPSLHIYDTVLEGIADVNDPSRDVDRLDTVESVQPMGRGVGRLRTAEVPNYVDMLRHVCGKLGWNPDPFHTYRCRIEYPIYGSQVVLAFTAPSDGG